MRTARVITVDKTFLKEILGEIPLTAEIFWNMRQSDTPPVGGFLLSNLERNLKGWQQVLDQIQCPQNEMGHVSEQAKSAREGWRQESNQAQSVQEDRKDVLIFATLAYWIEHTTMMGLALAGLGHRVTLGYLPYPNWYSPMNAFDLRRQDLYIQKVFAPVRDHLQIVSFTSKAGRAQTLPDALDVEIENISFQDTQYTLQVEEIDKQGDLYKLRCQRNRQAASALVRWLKKNKPNVIIVPNGTILEFGVVFQVSRYLHIPVVTYEFGEQGERIWLAQNKEIMKQNTNDLWRAYGQTPLSQEQSARIRELFGSRQRADLWGNFTRKWQGVPSAGGETLRASLGLDDRPVVLLAANVIGDSLTLGRQVFSQSMTNWLQRTVTYFAEHPQALLIIRIHPGEKLLLRGRPSVGDIVREVLPERARNIHIVPYDAPVNTYDLVEIAQLGLVYTTTVGMEMAMSGTPVIVAGDTHYRKKGFTLDPDTWDTYFQTLDSCLADLHGYQLTKEQVELAWRYAYYFFFFFPHPYPWHLLTQWEDVRERPLDWVLGEEGQTMYRDTFEVLIGRSAGLDGDEIPISDPNSPSRP